MPSAVHLISIDSQRTGMRDVLFDKLQIQIVLKADCFLCHAAHFICLVSQQRFLLCRISQLCQRYLYNHYPHHYHS